MSFLQNCLQIMEKPGAKPYLYLLQKLTQLMDRQSESPV